MSKVQVLGPRRLLSEVLQFLQNQGAVQLRSPPPTDRVSPREAFLRSISVSPEDTATEGSLEESIRQVDALLSALPAAPALRTTTEVELPEPISPTFRARLEAIGAELHALQLQRAALGEEREVVDRYGRLLAAIAPLRPSLPAVTELHTVGLVMRREPPEALVLLEDEVRELTGGAYDLQSRPIDDDLLGLLLTVPRASSKKIAALLLEQGVEEIRLPAAYSGQPLVEALTLLLKRGQRIPAELDQVDSATEALAARWQGALKTARREARSQLERIRALGQCSETAHAFVIFCWVPRGRLADLIAASAARFAGSVTMVEHAIARSEYPAVPVVIKNPPWLEPFELLLALVPLPRYGSIDPTPYLAFFFPLFFGLILGDVGFGVVALGLAASAWWKGWGGATGRKAAAIALACAASTILFGILYGEAFGGIGEHLGLRPLLFDRRRAVLPFQGIALALGAIHVLFGIALGLAEAVRLGDVREAVMKGTRLVLVVAAALAIGWAAGYVPARLGQWSLAAVGLLLSAAIAVGGLTAPLELVLALGNILSYARLMALGLASVLLAEVANRLAGSVKPAALAFSIAIVLHAANFAMAMISPTVCALRLHYVEFFEKFYQEGGAPFRPFALGA